jgi:hypothetical protein
MTKEELLARISVAAGPYFGKSQMDAYSRELPAFEISEQDAFFHVRSPSTGSEVILETLILTEFHLIKVELDKDSISRSLLALSQIVALKLTNQSNTTSLAIHTAATVQIGFTTSQADARETLRQFSNSLYNRMLSGRLHA